MTCGAGHEFTVDLAGTNPITGVTGRFFDEFAVFEQLRQIVRGFVATEHLVKPGAETDHGEPAQGQHQDQRHDVQNKRHALSLFDRTYRAARGNNAMVSEFHHEAGWVAVENVLTATKALDAADQCTNALANLGADLRVGDKPAAGTRRLADVFDRVPVLARIAEHEGVKAVVTDLLGPKHVLGAVTYRSPQPGYGGQKLHCDAIALTEIQPASGITMILALTEFTTDNGPTVVIPRSHLRIDLQRKAGQMEAPADAVALTGPAGTGFLFTHHLLHGGTQNRSNAPRPALQLSWNRC